MPTKQLFEHLDSTSLQDIIDRYYKGENVAALLKEFDITCHPGLLWRNFPPDEVGRDCPICSTPLGRTGAVCNYGKSSRANPTRTPTSNHSMDASGMNA